MDRLLQNLLRQNGFYMLNKVLVHQFGLVEAAVLAMLIDKHAQFGEGFFVTADTAQADLNIGRKPYERALTNLKEKGVVSTVVKGVPPRTYYTIDYNIVAEALSAGQIDLSKTDKLNCPEGTNYNKNIDNKNNPSLSKDNTPKGVESETVEVETISEEELMFDTFRKAYKGTKRGLQTEFTNFKKKHKDWREVLSILLPSYQAQQTKREQALRQGCFVPQEKNLSTYINQRCWEAEEHFEPDSRSQQRAQQVVPGFVTPEGQARQKRVDEFVEALANS